MSVNHLLLADDCLFTCKANEDQSANLHSILQRYGDVSGQVINPAKSSITFGKWILEEVKNSVRMKLVIEAEGGAFKYLGLPECLKGSKVQLFAYIKERLNKIISGWYEKNPFSKRQRNSSEVNCVCYAGFSNVLLQTSKNCYLKPG